jgi:hypothetical protein
MVTVDSWTKYVDKVLSELPMGGVENKEMTKLCRENKVGEYEPGIKPDEFREIIEGLESGDVITFRFKGCSRWPMTFLALFSTKTTCFKYIKDQLPTYKAVNYWAMVGTGPSSSWSIKCRIRSVPISKEHNMDWMTRYLGIFLKDVTVEKRK